ncbi:protein of unknown function [Burkholderia multivorans]
MSVRCVRAMGYLKIARITSPDEKFLTMLSDAEKAMADYNNSPHPACRYPLQQPGTIKSTKSSTFHTCPIRLLNLIRTILKAILRRALAIIHIY